MGFKRPIVSDNTIGRVSLNAAQIYVMLVSRSVQNDLNARTAAAIALARPRPLVFPV